MDRSIGVYQIRSIAGRGAMGTVYEAWDPKNERRVAIKVIDLTAADQDVLGQEVLRFQREAEIARQLVHPNIVRNFDAGQTDREAFMVMEFIDGESIKDMLDAGRRFPLAETLGIMDAVLHGLQYSHSRGVVHRDIKPANLMVTGEGVVKIADFGIARIEGSNMTQTGMMIGTPAYMSPEQFMCEPVDARSDVYSMGVLLFQLLTGERPFEGSMASIMYKALNTQVPKPSALSVQVPSALDGVVARAMARSPADRYPSAEAFADALAAAMSEATVIAPASPPPAQQPATQPATQPRATVSAAPPNRAVLATLPAYVQPEPVHAAPTMSSRMGGVVRFMFFLVLLGGAALVAFDLYLDQPIGTLPNLQNLSHPPPLPGSSRSFR